MYRRIKVDQIGIHWGSFCMGAASFLMIASLALVSEQAWDDSITWRVHHVPAFATQSERDAVQVSDDLRETGTKLRAAIRALGAQVSR